MLSYLPSIRLLALLAGGLASSSCGDTTAPAHPPASFGFINGPGEPGNSGLFRFEGELVSALRDNSTGLVSLVGWPHSVADFCDFVGTGGLADEQAKPHSAGEVNSLIVDRDAMVKVFVVGPNDRLCINMRDATPRYQGTGRFLRTDNNLTESGTEGGRANSFGWTAHATLTDRTTGTLVKYNEKVQFVVNPQTEELATPVLTIKIGQ